MHGAPTAEETAFDARGKSGTDALWTLTVILRDSSALSLTKAELALILQVLIVVVAAVVIAVVSAVVIVAAMEY